MTDTTAARWKCERHNSFQSHDEFCFKCVCEEHAAFKEILRRLKSTLVEPSNRNSVSGCAAAARTAVELFDALAPTQDTDNPGNPNEDASDPGLADASLLLF